MVLAIDHEPPAISPSAMSAPILWLGMRDSDRVGDGRRLIPYIVHLDAERRGTDGARELRRRAGGRARLGAGKRYASRIGGLAHAKASDYRRRGRGAGRGGGLLAGVRRRDCAKPA